MDKAEKIRRMENVTEKLEGLEGVEEAILDDYVPSTANSGQIVVTVEHGNPYDGVYDLKPNLRSLAQRMRYKLKDSDLFNFTVYEKPKKEYNVVDEPIGHDSACYMIEVVP